MFDAVSNTDEVLRRRSVPPPNRAPAARSLLLTVLGEYVLGEGAPVWNATLLRALGELGVLEKTARQAITRSAADGWLRREPVGRSVRWHLTLSTTRLLTEGAQRIYSFSSVAEEWDGRWLLVRVSVPERVREQRHVARSRLAWEGFGTLGQGWWISPHVDRRPDLDTVAGEGAPSLMTLVVQPGSGGDEQALVDEAWGDRRELQRDYTRFINWAAGRRPTTAAEVFVAQTLLVHHWRKFPIIDPGLPRHLLPDPWIGLEAAEVFADRHTEWTDDARDWFAAECRE
jgi:phenylacetic acid degradation operon negative regulatory protein